MFSSVSIIIEEDLGEKDKMNRSKTRPVLSKSLLLSASLLTLGFMTSFNIRAEGKGFDNENLSAQDGMEYILSYQKKISI